MPKIIIPDGYTANPGDLSWNPIARHGDLTVFDRTPPEKILERLPHVEILVVNKLEVSAALIAQLPKLACICTLATGYNNIDIQAAKKKGIPVCNAVGYSSTSVAQHVFALLLEFTNRVAEHSKDVQQNGWATAPDWCYWKFPLNELSGKTMGIFGFGKIGQEVAKIALAFGMNVLATRRSNRPSEIAGVKLTDWNTLLEESDVLTLHAPLTQETANIINANALARMKSSTILINTGRGGLVNEKDLEKALRQKIIFGAGLDVLQNEPPRHHHPLTSLPNCLITPHLAWATRASRQRLIKITGDNISAFLNGNPQNVVNQ